MGKSDQGKSLFRKNFFTLFKGSFISQLIPLAISPFLTRLYTPEDFGALSLFVAITSILGSVINGRYEQAIMLVNDKRKINLITLLSLLIALFISVFLLLILLIFNETIIQLLDFPSFSIWLYYIPLVSFLISVFNTFNFYHLKQKELKSISSSEIQKATIFSVVQLIYPFFREGAFGLIIGKIISTFYTSIYLFKKSSFNFTIFDKKQLLQISKRFINFPKYTTPAILLNNLSVSGIQLLIPFFYSATTLGFYSIMNKVMSAPFGFIGNSISQAFLKEISDSKKNVYDVTKSILLKLVLISFIGYGLSFLLLEDFFQFVYGENWRVAGTFAKYLTPFFIFKFIASPLTSIHTAFEKQRLSFLLQILMFLVSVGSLSYSYISELNFEQFLFLFSVLMSLYYILRILIVINISKKSK